MGSIHTIPCYTYPYTASTCATHTRTPTPIHTTYTHKQYTHNLIPENSHQRTYTSEHTPTSNTHTHNLHPRAIHARTTYTHQQYTRASINTRTLHPRHIPIPHLYPRVHKHAHPTPTTSACQRTPNTANQEVQKWSSLSEIHESIGSTIHNRRRCLQQPRKITVYPDQREFVLWGKRVKLTDLQEVYPERTPENILTTIVCNALQNGFLQVDEEII